MDIKEKFAKKMLDEKLDFLPLAESIELFDSGINLETRFSWVMGIEEIPDYDDLTTEELFKTYDDIYGLDNDCYLKVGKAYDEFDEFTLELCPAPTYIDLIK